MNAPLQLQILSRDILLTHLDALADILENCVNGGASVSFMLPFSHEKARAFWLNIAASVARGERTVLACFDEQRQLIGTVQLITDQPEKPTPPCRRSKTVGSPKRRDAKALHWRS
ncbi:N-acetyltransferase GCN5 [Enterobacter cancerogenus]|uniref:N-acetyltransferase GCN5 n=1 Tax=Enterobacter cancerogenus TaxID=69218 RepID=A0A484XQB8_9ENTR|nr:N-acetyltransferase GCN5 [Enterobacter cancerogenus]